MSIQNHHAQSFARKPGVQTSSACRWNIRTCARFGQNLKSRKKLRMSLEYSEPKFVENDGRADRTPLRVDRTGLPTAPIIIQKPSATPCEIAHIASIGSL